MPSISLVNETSVANILNVVNRLNNFYRILMNRSTFFGLYIGLAPGVNLIILFGHNLHTICIFPNILTGVVHKVA